MLAAFAVASSIGFLLASNRRQRRLRAWRLAVDLAGGSFGTRADGGRVG